MFCLYLGGGVKGCLWWGFFPAYMPGADLNAKRSSSITAQTWWIGLRAEWHVEECTLSIIHSAINKSCLDDTEGLFLALLPPGYIWVAERSSDKTWADSAANDASMGFKPTIRWFDDASTWTHVAINFCNHILIILNDYCNYKVFYQIKNTIKAKATPGSGYQYQYSSNFTSCYELAHTVWGKGSQGLSFQSVV